MKGDKNFRDATKSSMQCSNEVYIYKEVLPYFKKIVTESDASLSTDWCPRVYFADYKVFPELSDDQETILALENLKPFGYRLGSRIDLDETHLQMMIKHIATYHAVNYSMRIKKDPMLEALAKGLTPFSYLQKDGQEMESYKILFVIALERFFNVIESNSTFKEDKNFCERVQKFKKDYLNHPLTLMEKFHENDDIFSIILHGDYNRNNVLFQYDQCEGYENPKAIKMIDFQEVRYATPAIDLMFFMYMNIPPELRPKIWDSLLELYHETLTTSLIDILKCENNDELLEPYSFPNFIAHFKKNAFYGVMIGIHFIPWMACPEEQCQEMSHLFETDIQSPELRRLCQICGGNDVDYRITSIAEHAYQKGYMDIFK
jgi:Ecdysteroid kinase-like family